MDKTEHTEKRFLYTLAILLGMIGVFALCFWGYIRHFNWTLMEENRIRLSEVSDQIAGYMQTKVEEEVDKLQILAVSLNGRKEKLAYLDDMAGQMGYEYIGIAQRDGILTAKGLPEPKDISQEACFRTALAGKIYISDLTRQIFYDRAVGGVVFAVPITDGDQQILVAMMSSSKMGENVRVESFEGNGYSYVIDQEGDLVIHARSLEYNNFFLSMQNMDFSPGYDVDTMREDILNRQEGMVIYSNLGVEKYAYYRPLGVNGWTVISTVPRGVITERTAALSRNLIFLCLVFILVFLIMLIVACSLYLRLEGRKRANEAKSAFLANMSHDMRTPMNAIIGMAAIAQDRAQEPDAVRDCLKKIMLSSRLLLGLINDILDTARIESGKMVLASESFGLAEVMESAVNSIFPAMIAKHQHFSVRLHHLTQEYFCGDSMRLGQIFINILNNAVKFTPDNGYITVDIWELPRQKEDTAILKFIFTDTGIGMKPDFAREIFSAFSRERDSKVDKIEGSGLGMSIVKGIVDLMQGKIEVSSEVGKGTVFTVTLPMAADLSKREGKVLNSSAIAVGEDRSWGEEVVWMLEEMGVRGEWAADGDEAAEKISEAYSSGEGFQFVLLDRKIFISGEAAKIQQTCPDSVTLILAAYDWEDVRESAAEAGIQIFVQKPLFPSTLYDCLSGAMGHQKKVPEIDTAGEELKGKRILLAEDNELNMEIAQQIFTKLGAVVSGTRNGLECLNCFLASPAGSFDMILMDIQMPCMNGYEAARRIRQAGREDSSIPVFAMSANAFPEDMEAARAAGMTGYLTKPVDISEWVREIRSKI